MELLNVSFWRTWQKVRFDRRSGYSKKHNHCVTGSKGFMCISVIQESRTKS